MMLRERRAIHGVALIVNQEQSPWYFMYSSRHTPSFISTVSLPPRAFDNLLLEFSKHYKVHSRYGRGGRPPRIPYTHAVLAMLLHYYTTAVEHKTLQELFGVAPTTFSRVIRKAEIALSHALESLGDSRIIWPDQQTQTIWAEKSNAREPLVYGVFAFLDGKNFRVQAPSRTDLQNGLYNGWLHSVFVAGLDGTLIWGRHNCPGSWNDGEVSRRLQEFIARPGVLETGMKIVADSAFPVTGRCEGKVITPLKEGDLDRQPPECRLALQAMSDSIVSLRQAAEWGMGAVGKVYRQLQLPLPFDPDLRAV
ncbi:hypothetical protein AC1031_003100 [Aphanomyces cochlioides]|nr:hypothetical protein AC1031_003100 [Aphanomyces cochlioides]